MSKADRVTQTVVLLLVGVILGYLIAYLVYQPRVADLESQLPSLERTVRTVTSELSEARELIRSLGENLSAARSELSTVKSKLDALLLPNVAILTCPASVTPGEHYPVVWNVSGGIPGKITEAAVYWGLKPRDLGSPLLGFENPSDIFTGDTPQAFTALLSAPQDPRRVYVRARAVVDGADYWSDEKEIVVEAPTGFSISLDVDCLWVVRGTSAGVTLSAVPISGFNAGVYISVLGTPTGLATTIQPWKVLPPAQVTVTVAPASNASLGLYIVSVAAIGDTISRSDAFSVRVVEAPSEAWVEIRSISYNPMSTIIKRGGTVTWINRDPVAHTVTGQGFDSGRIDPGGSWSHTFDSPGIYSYGCKVFPSMAGFVRVV